LVHSFDVNESHGIIDEANFENFIFFGVGAHAGTTIDFEEPGFAVRIENEVESVQLKGLRAIGD
jgi:hypothetical protein